MVSELVRYAIQVPILLYRNSGNFHVKNIHVFNSINARVPMKYFNTDIFFKSGLVHEIIHEQLKAECMAIAIYLSYGPRFFPSDAAGLADTYTHEPLDTCQLTNTFVPGYMHVKTRDHLGQRDHFCSLFEIFKQQQQHLI